MSQDLLPKATYSEALSLVPTANKTTHCGHSPQGRGERLTLGVRMEEDSEEQQQRPGYAHHPAAWQQLALAAWNHCLRHRSECVQIGNFSWNTFRAYEGRESKEKEENRKLRFLSLLPLFHHNHH